MKEVKYIIKCKAKDLLEEIKKVTEQAKPLKSNNL